MDNWEIEGCLATGGATGIKANHQPDLALISFPEGANWSVVTTVHQLRSHTVRRAEKLKDAIPRRPLQAIVVNSGNANACTGEDGPKAVDAVIRAAAMHLDAEPDQIVNSSTGVIGVPLETHKIRANIKSIADGLSTVGWGRAAGAICTTDDGPKIVYKEIKNAEGVAIGSVGGIAKGAGMIGPNMATMLCYVVTDLTFSNEQLDELLTNAVKQSFNCIIVDGDQSTNDSVFLAATCKKHVDVIDLKERFQDVLNELTLELALKIVKDGEGARRIGEIVVSGALTDEDATKIAREIGRSPLVKTALYGADPNWGRIAMAAGNAGVPLLEEALVISVGGIDLLHRGENLMSASVEEAAAEAMQKEVVLIEVKIGRGPGTARIWASDLGHEYITINADYRS